MVKHIQKRIKLNIKIHQSDMSIENLTRKGEWPEGGLLQLQNVIRTDKRQWVETLVRANSRPTNRSQYNRYMNLLSASLYCFSCQGRVGAIEDLTLSQGEELLLEGVVLSTKFKTRAKFGYQPVTLPPDKTSTFLVTYYLQNVRPKMLQGSNDPFFINFNGTAKFNIAKGLQNYFAQSLSLKITSTRMRAIIETSFEELLENGAISSAQKLSIENTVGHDGATARDYYVKRSRFKDTKNSFDAFDVFDNVNGIFESDDDGINSPSITIRKETEGSYHQQGTENTIAKNGSDVTNHYK
jgi:hypothetical protein